MGVSARLSRSRADGSRYRARAARRHRLLGPPAPRLARTRVRHSQPTWIVAVGTPDRPAIATMCMSHTRAGIDITLALGYASGRPCRWTLCLGWTIRSRPGTAWPPWLPNCGRTRRPDHSGPLRTACLIIEVTDASDHLPRRRCRTERRGRPRHPASAHGK
ncbi:DUF6177 family protein [Streptomyces sp. NBC_00481]|uniref:DUF6177 family protein n=1 Tax=Streptomyces sp. NBC_00481 TaxID=2975755 RepID=UPI003FA3B083